MLAISPAPSCHCFLPVTRQRAARASARTRRLIQPRHDTGVAINLYRLTVSKYLRGISNAYDGRNVIFASHHGAVTENAAHICHHPSHRSK